MDRPDWDSIDVDDQAIAAIDHIRALIPGVPPPTDIYEGLAYPIAADTSRFLRQEMIAGNTSYFPALFDRIEDLIINGTPPVRKLAIIGLLEDLQKDTLDADLSLDVWNRWLGTKSSLMWAAVNDFWNGDHRALEKAERKSGLSLSG